MQYPLILCFKLLNCETSGVANLDHLVRGKKPLIKTKAKVNTLCAHQSRIGVLTVAKIAKKAIFYRHHSVVYIEKRFIGSWGQFFLFAHISITL